MKPVPIEDLLKASRTNGSPLSQEIASLVLSQEVDPLAIQIVSILRPASTQQVRLAALKVAGRMIKTLHRAPHGSRSKKGV